MRKTLAALTIPAGFGALDPVSAAVVITSTEPGVLSNGGLEVTFNNLAIGSSPSGILTGGTGSFSGNGTIRLGTTSGQYATPFGDTSRYLAIQAGQQEVIKFATVQNYFGFLLGSADTHNIFVFKLGGVGGVTEGTFTGANLLSPGNGNQFSPLTIRDRQYLVCGPRARNLDDDDPGLHGRWLHGLSPQGAVHVPPRIIADTGFE